MLDPDEEEEWSRVQEGSRYSYMGVHRTGSSEGVQEDEGRWSQVLERYTTTRTAVVDGGHKSCI